jgi:hypothetical protein
MLFDEIADRSSPRGGEVGCGRAGSGVVRWSSAETASRPRSDSRRSLAEGGEGAGSAPEPRETSVVWTMPWTTTRVPGGGNWRGCWGAGEGSGGAGGGGGGVGGGGGGGGGTEGWGGSGEPCGGAGAGSSGRGGSGLAAGDLFLRGQRDLSEERALDDDWPMEVRRR